MAVPDRLLLDALTSYLKSEIGNGLVNWSLTAGQRAEAEELLPSGDHSHILVTDIVAFYEYVRRAQLVDELLDVSGDDEAVAALESLIAAVMDDADGLPQGAPSVTALADVYLSIVRPVDGKVRLQRPEMG